MATSTTARFTLNFVGNTIVGTKASFDKAGKGSGAIYNELVALMVKHPTFGFEVKKQEKRSAKPKQTYPGMDCDFMRDYLAAKEMTDALNTFNQVEAFAENSKKSKYPLLKKFFLKQFPKDENDKVIWDYTDAKKIVSEYRYNLDLDKAKKPAPKVKGTRSIERPKSDIILLPPASSF